MVYLLVRGIFEFLLGRRQFARAPRQVARRPSPPRADHRLGVKTWGRLSLGAPPPVKPTQIK